MRTLCVGDIHGGHKALLQCLERSGFNKEEDTLIQLGDVADGWSQTPQCVDELLSIPNLISIRGNHDKWCEEWMSKGVAANNWINQGGKATRDAYLKEGFIINHLDRFFKKQHNYYIDDQNRAFVHGGYTSEKGLGHEQHQATYYWDRELWMIALSGEATQRGGHSKTAELPRRLRAHKEIFIGHTTTGNWGKDTPMNACNVWNLDTGGGFEGKLTIMDVDTKEYWQSDTVKDLYPEENGR